MGHGVAEPVRVYEKIRPGIWVYNGLFELVDCWAEFSGGRNVFKFKLRFAGTDELAEPTTTSATTEDDRLIPSWVKLEVWKRDRGQCVTCGTVPPENLEVSERRRIILLSQFSPPMLISLTTLLATLCLLFRSRVALELENLALRHQIGVLQRSARKRPRLTPVDRLLWVWLSRIWGDWRSALAIVRPETVVAWHRAGFRLFWTWKVRRGQPGRPTIAREVRDLIRKMCRENPGWGAPRIHGELLKLGIDVAETVTRSPS